MNCLVKNYFTYAYIREYIDLMSEKYRKKGTRWDLVELLLAYYLIPKF
jgi:exonuclease I